MDGYWKIPLMKEIDHLKEEIKKAPHSQQVYNQCSYIRGYIYALNVTGIIDGKTWLSLEEQLQKLIFW